jgi:hypothetical protein
MSVHIGMTVRERVQRMIKRHPDWSDRQVAEKIGCTPATVWKARHPERNAEWLRRDNKIRREAKRAWQAEYDRSPAGRARCSRCGELCGAASRRSGVELCRACQLAAYAEHTDQQAREYERLWNEGKTIRQIADALGIPMNSARGFSSKYREAGYDLPYRRTPEQVERIRNGRRAVAA